MFATALVIAFLSTIVLLAAWQETANANRRDAKLLAGIGACGLFGSVAVATL